MTEITVDAERVVNTIYVEEQLDIEPNVQGSVQYRLTAPPGTTAFKRTSPTPKGGFAAVGSDSVVVASTRQTRRNIVDLPPEVQAAIEMLKAAVLVWEAEDLTAPPEDIPPSTGEAE